LKAENQLKFQLHSLLA